MSTHTTPVPRTSSGIVKETFPVLEMTCAACAVSVESMLRSVDGVADAGVNFANASAWVTYDPQRATPVQLQSTVRAIGYDLVIEKEGAAEVQEAAQARHYRHLQRRMLWAALLSAPLVVIGMFFMNMPYANWIMLALATPVVGWIGRDFFRNAWKQGRHGRANMDTLVALSTGIAYGFSLFNTVYPEFWHRRGLHAHVYFEAAAVVIAFISLGKLLEEKAKSNTSSALRKLIGLQPKTVHRIDASGAVQEVPAAAVQKGDVLLVKPGERIPADGTLIGGASYVDESAINGEPVPVLKEAGAAVSGGSINGNGSFRFRAEKVGADTLLAGIIRAVREAQGSRAPVQRLVDRIAGIFVPVVLGIAVLTFLAWMLLGGTHAFTHALLTSITVLVIACPCALGLATPTAIMVGVGKGAEQGLLIRDAESLELAHRVTDVVLDKTGTITEGRPRVTGMQFAEAADEKKLQRILLSLEEQSEHPLARAIAAHLEEEGAAPVALERIESQTGRGIVADYEGARYSVGNRALLEEQGAVPDEQLETVAARWRAEARTVLFFAREKAIVAVVAIADSVKPGSAAAVAALKGRGIRVHLLTGDNPETAAAVAAQVGIDAYRAGQLPADKAAYIKRLQEAGSVVAMAGDGINDAPALAQADVSIAMGRGSDIALDAARMTLLSSDLNGIPKALSLSRGTVRTIRQNLFWAFIYNLVGIPLAAGVLYPVNGFLLDPMIAGAAMALSSVSVVGNSLRLKWSKL
ncbi:heavy metal translocating P-type ATPase [Flaviaesturariibacter amylovorans]|uniref:Heavy metal translocating P-type ATPase n=1 Tax=Flaviaesturariibacter amylovorans TaxID=1084520 RepID=A0ABP8GC91_9BACT